MANAAATEVVRSQVLRSSRQYYSRRAYYYDLLSQRRPSDKETRRELAFLEFAFRKKAARRVARVLDVACGGGRHIVGLAQRGYQCTGQDFTPERVEITRKRAARFKVSVELCQGDATKLGYDGEFDAVLALNVLFLLPSDDDVKRCIVGAYRALRPGGVLVCNIFNALATGRSEARRLTNNEDVVSESRGRGIRITAIEKLKGYDPVLGVGWVHTTSIIEAPDGRHVFHDKERLRFFTYWDIMNLTSQAGFKHTGYYTDWKTKPSRKTTANELVFVARK